MAAVGAVGMAGATAAGAGAGNRESPSSIALEPVASQNSLVALNHVRQILVLHLQSSGHPFTQELIGLILAYAGQNLYTNAPRVPCKHLTNGGFGFSFSKDQVGNLLLGVLHAAEELVTLRSLECESAPQVYRLPKKFPIPGDFRLAPIRDGVFCALISRISQTNFLRFPDVGDQLTVESRGWESAVWSEPGNDRMDAYTYDSRTGCLLTMHAGCKTGMTVSPHGTKERSHFLFHGKRVLAALGVSNSTIFSVTTTGVFSANADTKGPKPVALPGAYRAATSTPDLTRFVMQDAEGIVSTYALPATSGPPATFAPWPAFQADVMADFMATNRFGTVALLPTSADQCSLWDLETGVQLLTLYPRWESPVKTEGAALSDSSLSIVYHGANEIFKMRKVMIYDLRASAQPARVTTL